MQDDLDEVKKRVSVLKNQTQEDVDKMLANIKRNGTLTNFKKLGNKTVNGFLRKLTNVMSAMDKSVQIVLAASNFLNVSYEVNKTLNEAMTAMNATIMNVKAVKNILSDLDPKLGVKGNYMQLVVTDDFERIRKALYRAMNHVKTTVNHKMSKGFELILNQLQKKVAIMLPGKDGMELIASSKLLRPMLSKILWADSNPIMKLKDGFNAAIKIINAPNPKA